MIPLTRDELINLHHGLTAREALAFIRREVMLINDEPNDDAFLVVGERVLKIPHATLLQRIEQMLLSGGEAPVLQ